MTVAFGEISSRIARVRERIARACERVGRDPGAVTLVAVTKTHPAAAVRAAYEAGQRDFGENYVQELLQKATEVGAGAGGPKSKDATEVGLRGDVRWHFVGHLQRNKIKQLMRVGAVIHSVDSLRLGEEIAKRSALLSVVTPVLVQVNVGREAQKSGCEPEDTAGIVQDLRSLAALDVWGLMTVPPQDDDPEQARSSFRALRELAQRLELRELSMGMTRDIDVAVEEGATIVRVGTAIFGER